MVQMHVSNADSPNHALEDLLTLIEDYHDFNPSQVQVLNHPPTPIEFSRQVSKGLPCVWPTHSGTLAEQLDRAKRWAHDRLCELVTDDVEVAVTPDGRADALCAMSPDPSEMGKVFLQPANVRMSMREFLQKLLDRQEGGGTEPVHYLQSQNSNLTSTPLQTLLSDVPQNLDLAKDVLGEPEAVNLWIGDERSVTSAHRDPYENLYVVLRGSKTFTLWPPVDEVCLNARMVKTGRRVYDRETNTFTTILDENEDGTAVEIPWVSIDPQLPRKELDRIHSYYRHARPQTITISQGEMLYLPSGWYHHVAQRCGQWDDGSRAPCVAINYWYDMDYEGEKYSMRQLISRLVQRVPEQN